MKRGGKKSRDGTGGNSGGVRESGYGYANSNANGYAGANAYLRSPAKSNGNGNNSNSNGNGNTSNHMYTERGRKSYGSSSSRGSKTSDRGEGVDHISHGSANFGLGSLAAQIEANQHPHQGNNPTIESNSNGTTDNTGTTGMVGARRRSFDLVNSGHRMQGGKPSNPQHSRKNSSSARMYRRREPQSGSAAN